MRALAATAAKGDGLLIAQEWFGALPGDGIDSVHHLTVGDELVASVVHGRDYTQGTYVFRVSGAAETVDVATDALLQAAGAGGLDLVRRDNAPGPQPVRRIR